MEALFFHTQKYVVNNNYDIKSLNNEMLRYNSSIKRQNDDSHNYERKS